MRLMESTKRLFSWLDILKFVCAFLVIYIHTEPLKEVQPLANSILLCFSHVGVAVFFVLSGFFFAYGRNAGNQVPSASGMGVFVRRVLRLYAVWWIPNMALYVIYAGALSDIMMWLFFGIWHLWYLAGLLQIALVIAVWRHFFCLRYLWYASGAVYAIGALLSTYSGYLPVDKEYFFFVRNGFVYGLFFFLTGVHINAWQESVGNFCRQGRLMLLLGIALLLQLAEAAYICGLRGTGGTFDFYLGQMLLAPLLVVFWLNFPAGEAVRGAFSIGIRRGSTLIYCVHVPVMVCLMLWGQLLPAVVAGVFGMDERMANFCLVSAGACMFAGLVLLLHRYMPWLRFLW